MVQLPEGWGQGKPGKKPKPSGLKLVYFDGGPLDGQLVRWYDPAYPPYWDHVVRQLNPHPRAEVKALTERKLPIIGECKVEGAPHYILESRFLHRYRVTTRTHGPNQAQVYEPAAGPVPIEWDDVREEWKDPGLYDVGRNPLGGQLEMGEIEKAE